LKEVYLDNSATTKISDEAAKAVYDVMTKFYGNPSSLHSKGIEAEKLMTQAREQIAAVLGVTPKEIFFTSGGTESNNLAIRGTVQAMKRQGNHLITTKIEHPSVLEVFKQLESEGFDVTYLNVDSKGNISLEELKESITPKTILVSIMYVNNEVGSILPIEGAGEIIKQNKNTIFHVDGVQAFGKIPLVPKLKNIDLLSMSSHKIHGPKGVGALFIREKTKITPIFQGGGQERGLRSGTENVPGIAGFGVAAASIQKNLTVWQSKMQQLKENLKLKSLNQIPDTILNGPTTGGAPHILNISFLGVKGEILLHYLESHGIYVSTGSACSSNKQGKSHVLSALGKSFDEIDGAIRFSLSHHITQEDIDYTVDVLKKEVAEVRKFVGR
jgi:cysteine desulfurase